MLFRSAVEGGRRIRGLPHARAAGPEMHSGRLGLRGAIERVVLALVVVTADGDHEFVREDCGDALREPGPELVERDLPRHISAR